MTEETTTPITETPAQRMLREAMAAMAAAQAAVDEEEKAKADAIAAEVEGIDTTLAKLDDRVKELDRQIGILREEAAALLTRRNTLVPPVPAPTARNSTNSTSTGKLPSTAVDGATKKYQTEKYMFWKAYQRAFKGQPGTPDHSQATLTAICTANNIPFMPDVATLNRVRDLITRSGR